MGSTTVEQPSPPPQPSTQQAVEAYTENLPAMYETQLEYGPKMTGQQVGMLQEFLPQVTQLQQGLQQQYRPQNVAQQVGLQTAYAPVLAAQQRQLQQLAQPETVAAREAMGGLVGGDYLQEAPYQEAESPLLERMGGLVDQDYLTGYQPEEAPGFQEAKERVRQDIRGSWASRGLAESGMSAEDEARLMAEMEYPYAMQQEQMRLGELGRRQQQATQLGQLQTGLQESAMGRQLSELGRRQNVGLSMAGLYRVPQQPQIGMGNINVPGLQPANAMAGYNFPQVQGAMQQGYGNYAGAYGSMYKSNAMLAGQRNEMMGKLIGGGLGSLGTMLSSRRFKKNICLWN